MTKIKKNLSEFVQQKRIQKKKQLNPFEVHINRDKQKILGRKNKNDRGLPGISRAKAINRRKQSLLQEYKIKNKDNIFLDKRIGEKDSTMCIEDKALARFTMERKKAHKRKNIFNLNDDEVLTHRGQTLEEIEKFDDPKSDDELSDDENNSGKLDKSFVETHFGGGVLSKPNSALSRKDLIDQLIAESKKRKIEKQKIREQTIDLTEKLDSEWKDLLPLISVTKKSDDINEITKADTYDTTVQELKFEARGNPSEKLKSEEEIIQEEKNRLEMLEADRLGRMKGFVSDMNNSQKHRSADDLDDSFLIENIEDTDINHDNLANDKNGNSSEKDNETDDNDNNQDDNDDSSSNDDEDDDNDNVSDDDGDNNDNENDDNDNEKNDNKCVKIKLKNIAEKKMGKSTISNKNSNRNQEEIYSKLSCPKNESDMNSNNRKSKEDSDDDFEDNLSDLKESESSSEDENEDAIKRVTFASNLIKVIKTDQSKQVCPKSILKVNNTAHLQDLSKNKSKQEIRDDLKLKEIMEEAQKELSYTYNVPESFKELEKLLETHNSMYQSIIIDRMIKCNHWTLDGKNKEKLSNLFVYLLQYINDCASTDNVDDLIKCFQIFDKLCPYLYDLAHMNAENAKTCIQEIIKEKHDEFERNKKKYPNMDTLIFFKLVSLLFPTSDFRHPVVTPCLIFMSQILFKSRIKSRQDIAKGLFICTLILEYTVLSKRFAPSVINFLRGIIYTATPEISTQKIKIIPPFKKVYKFLLINENQSDIKIDPNDAHMKASDLIHGELNDEFRIKAVITAVNMIKEFKNQFQELEAVYAIFEPIHKLLKVNRFEKYPLNIRKYITKLCEELEFLHNKKLERIVREKKRPKPLRLYEPKIMTVYDGKQHKSMSKEKAEREKLLHKYKREMKGAIREIRRDRAFLTKVQISQQIKSDAERKRKVKEIFGDAAMQQSELKKIKRKK